jgi:hypothetical protein
LWLLIIRTNISLAIPGWRVEKEDDCLFDKQKTGATDEKYRPVEV